MTEARLFEGVQQSEELGGKLLVAEGLSERGCVSTWDGTQIFHQG